MKSYYIADARFKQFISKILQYGQMHNNFQTETFRFILKCFPIERYIQNVEELVMKRYSGREVSTCLFLNTGYVKNNIISAVIHNQGKKSYHVYCIPNQFIPYFPSKDQTLGN